MIFWVEKCNITFSDEKIFNIFDMAFRNFWLAFKLIDHKIIYIVRSGIFKKGLFINKSFYHYFYLLVIKNYCWISFLSTIVADHWASAIFLSLTKASPLYFHTLPWDLIASIFNSNLQSGITGFLNLAFQHSLKKLIYFHMFFYLCHERSKLLLLSKCFYN